MALWLTLEKLAPPYLLVVPILLASLSIGQTAPSLQGDPASSFCAGKDEGPYIDESDPRCFFFCHAGLDKGKANASGYRSCCEAATCFRLPSAEYPIGMCAACEKSAKKSQPKHAADTEAAEVSVQHPKEGLADGVASFAGGPLQRSSGDSRPSRGKEAGSSDTASAPGSKHPVELPRHDAQKAAGMHQGEPGQGKEFSSSDSHSTPSGEAPVELATHDARPAAGMHQGGQGQGKESDGSDSAFSPSSEALDDMASHDTQRAAGVHQGNSREGKAAHGSQDASDLWGTLNNWGEEVVGGLLSGLHIPAPALAPEPGTPAPVPPAPAPFVIPGVSQPVVETPRLPISTVEEFSGLTEKQLFDIFTQGVADIPSDLPGERGKFAICNRTNTLIPNGVGTRPGGYENASLPYADDLFNIVQQIWNGKVMYTDPASGKTTLWNLLLDQNTVDVLASVSADRQGISQDNKASVIIDYGQSDIPAARVIRDEMRRVGPVTWLGRAFFINPVLAALPISNATRPIVDALEPFTALSGAVVDVVEGLANATAASPITTPPPGYLPITLYFSCDCQSYFGPKLHYFPLLAEPLTAIQRLTGYVDPLYTLPSLTGPSGADPNAASIPQKNISDVDPFVLWPYNLANPNLDGLTNIKGFLQLPAKIFTRIFGTSWLPNLPIKGGWDPVLPARREGFGKGQAKLADTIVFRRAATLPEDATGDGDAAVDQQN